MASRLWIHVGRICHGFRKIRTDKREKIAMLQLIESVYVQGRPRPESQLAVVVTDVCEMSYVFNMKKSSSGSTDLAGHDGELIQQTTFPHCLDCK